MSQWVGGDIGLFCGDIVLFCGDIGLFGDTRWSSAAVATTGRSNCSRTSTSVAKEPYISAKEPYISANALAHLCVLYLFICCTIHTGIFCGDIGLVCGDPQHVGRHERITYEGVRILERITSQVFGAHNISSIRTVMKESITCYGLLHMLCAQVFDIHMAFAQLLIDVWCT